jgi:hypothetical protein
MDRQYYNKNLGTGMDQIGVHMSILWILQVSAIKFVLETIFLTIFLVFVNYLDRASNTENCRGLGANIPKTQRVPGVDGGLIL